MDDEIRYVRCVECGNEQPDMGVGVCCEECDCRVFDLVDSNDNQRRK